MAWLDLNDSPRYLSLAVGVVVLVLVVVWVFKIRDIQRVRVEIAQLETKLIKGQQVWKDYPPLSPVERKKLEKAQERLLPMLPLEKDIPALLQQISGLAREYNLSNISFDTGDKPPPPPASQQPASSSAPPQVVPPPAQQASPPSSKRPEGSIPKPPESSGPIAFVPLMVNFSGDYQEVAYFLDSLKKIPRVMTIQSVQLGRGVPLVGVGVTLYAYYQKGDIPIRMQ